MKKNQACNTESTVSGFALKLTKMSMHPDQVMDQVTVMMMTVMKIANIGDNTGDLWVSSFGVSSSYAAAVVAVLDQNELHGHKEL